MSSPVHGTGSCRLRSGGGFTLIEIMVTMLLTAVLVVALNGLWATVGEQFTWLVWRQQAVFVLNGHLERISRLYRGGHFASFPLQLYATTSGYPAGHENPLGDHAIMDSSDDIYDLVEVDPVAFDTTANNEGVILLHDPDGNGRSAGDRNVVWLDKGDGITGVLSWTTADYDAAHPCAGEVACQLLTVYLDFPYRYTAANPIEPLERVEVISLRTLVGRRQ